MLESIKRFFNGQSKNNKEQENVQFSISTDEEEEVLEDEEEVIELDEDLFYGPFKEFSIEEKSDLITKAIFNDIETYEKETYYFVRSNLTQNKDEFYFELFEEDDDEDDDGFYHFQITVKTNMDESPYKNISDLILTIELNTDYHEYINNRKSSKIREGCSTGTLILAFEGEHNEITFLSVITSLIDDILYERELFHSEKDEFATFFNLSKDKDDNDKNNEETVEYDEFIDDEMVLEVVKTYMKKNNLLIKNLVNNKITLDKKE